MATDALVHEGPEDPFFGGKWMWECLICDARQAHLGSIAGAKEAAAEHLGIEHDWLRGRYTIHVVATEGKSA